MNLIVVTSTGWPIKGHFDYSHLTKPGLISTICCSDQELNFSDTVLG